MQKRKQVHVSLCETVCRAFDLNMMCLHLLFVTSCLLSVPLEAVASLILLRTHTQCEQTLAYLHRCVCRLFTKSCTKGSRARSQVAPCSLHRSSCARTFLRGLICSVCPWLRWKTNGLLQLWDCHLNPVFIFDLKSVCNHNLSFCLFWGLFYAPLSFYAILKHSRWEI